MNGFVLAFTFGAFSSMLGDSRLMLILAQTFLLAFLSSLIATIIGTFGAIYIYQAKLRFQMPSCLSIIS